MRARKYRPVFLVDIAVPRNVDPSLNDLDNVYVYDVDDLTGIANENLESRRREAEQAEALVEQEAARFLHELAGDAVKPTIVALRQRADAIKGAELQRMGRLLQELDERQARDVQRLADGIVNKLLHDMLTGLKQAAADPGGPDVATVVEVVRRLHGLDEEEDG